jgi:hypothetical protein
MISGEPVHVHSVRNVHGSASFDFGGTSQRGSWPLGEANPIFPNKINRPISIRLRLRHAAKQRGTPRLSSTRVSAADRRVAANLWK